ncbi:MAG: ABC transporter permease [Hasllibacter sp.]
MIRVEPRPAPSAAWNALTPFLAVALTLLAGAAMFAALGTDPLAALKTIFWDPLFDPRLGPFSRPQLLVKAAPLILIAVGLSIGFRAGIWNIGAEGQYLVGAVAGAAAGLAFYPAETRLIFPMMVLAGLAGGVAWAMIPALLRAYARTNEILVSLLLVYVAENVIAWAALGPLRNPDAGGFPGSRQLNRWDAAANPELIAGTGAHWGVVAAVAAVVLAYAMFARHRLGYEVRLAGQAPRAARFAGVSPARLVILCFAISGGLAGLAGLFEATGPGGQISIDFGVGYGFTAIIVAFLGRLNPFGIVLAGLLMALTYIGGELAQMMVGIPLAAIQALQGMLLFFLLGVDVLSRYRIRLGRAPASEVAAAPRAEAAE